MSTEVVRAGVVVCGFCLVCVCVCMVGVCEKVVCVVCMWCVFGCVVWCVFD